METEVIVEMLRLKLNQVRSQREEIMCTELSFSRKDFILLPLNQN